MWSWNYLPFRGAWGHIFVFSRVPFHPFYLGNIKSFKMYARNFPKKGGGGTCRLPPAPMSHDKKRQLNLIIFLFFAIFAFIISLAKIIKQTLSNHAVLHWTRKLFLSVPIYLIILLPKREKKELYKISIDTLSKIFIKKRTCFSK